MKFGIFLAPFHRVGENPTLALKRDMQLIEKLDELGYDEVWIGEHHSYARELIADPFIFIAAAAERTRRIKLGTGVTSLPYHHPLMVADRVLQLDHMTEGRVMLGCGPGVLTSDAYMLGIDPVDQRRRMGESLEAIMHLLRSREPLTMETDWFTLRDGRLQMANFTDPHPHVAVAASFTPSGPTAAGKHGIGLLSVAGVSNDAFERTWGWAEEAAAESGKQVNRADWKVVIPIHLADSKAEAIEDVREGYKRQAYVGDRYIQDGAATPPPFAGGAPDIDGAIARDGVIVGSPDDAIAAVKRIQERSGGIGGILGLAHEWTSTEKTHRSYELWMRYVAPVFQGQLAVLEDNRNWIETRMQQVFHHTGAAQVKAFTDAGKELPPEMKQAMDAMRQARQ
ncbi:MAG TPA: LLM class flavin-dependent oxidoreductase [Tepidiformaceae bacterium]|nr:LLM class flavin-dependent oxidoreductase [Tepidiformaceae bacterium]HNO65446.1 LLM class flavin-dependent oxidoreductase [Tepidiformaceae bacterium]